MIKTKEEGKMGGKMEAGDADTEKEELGKGTRTLRGREMGLRKG